MFDIGWTEIVVVIIVACLILDVKDIANIIKLCRNFFKHFNEFINEAKGFITDIENTAQISTNKITDLEGNEQIAYDLDQIMQKKYKSIKNKNHEE